MPTNYRTYQPEQSYLLPPSPSDWLPENHLAFFISEVVNVLELSGFYERHEQSDPRGNQPFHPAMMLKVLIYAYSTGTFSSRRIAKKLEEDVAFRVLGAGNFPEHRTICDFRKENLQAFLELFRQVVQIAKSSGMVKLGRIAIDGTKIKANASRHKAMSYDRMKKEEKRLADEIANLLKQAEQTDRKEDQEHGPDNRGDELPEELRRRETRLQAIKDAKKRLEDRQAGEDREKGRHEGDGGRPNGKKGKPFSKEFGEPAEKAQENFTDPESRIMKMGNGFEQSYNAQASVDEANQIIVAVGLTNCAADNDQLIPMIEATRQNTGDLPQQVLADAGYRSEANFERTEQMQTDAVISLGREGKAKASPIAPTNMATLRMKEKLATPEAAGAYRRRKAIVEPVFGWIKHTQGFRQFSLRGIEKVTAEWHLVCLAINLRRMHTLKGAATA
ncbi:MAG TPA: IS1182 family transposase [Thermoanaerobaculia bacterium]|nr:IS1182 family transposase [Thermoanaerobaculia bacterium]